MTHAAFWCPSPRVFSETKKDVASAQIFPSHLTSMPQMGEIPTFFSRMFILSPKSKSNIFIQMEVNYIDIAKLGSYLFLI